MRSAYRGYLLCLLVTAFVLWGCGRGSLRQDDGAASPDTSTARETPDPPRATPPDHGNPPPQETASPDPQGAPRPAPDETASPAPAERPRPAPDETAGRPPQGVPPTAAPEPSSEVAGEEPEPGNPPLESGSLNDLVKRRLGKIVFNTPTEMAHDESRIIALLLSPTQTFDALREDLKRRTFQDDPQIGSATVDITKRMQATLRGSNFEIDEITDPIQAVRDAGTTPWQWEITPKEPGTHYLYLTLSAVLNLEGEPTPRVIDVYNRRIDVRITFPERIAGFIGRHFGKFVGACTVLLGFFGLWLNHFRKKRSDTKNEGA